MRRLLVICAIALTSPAHAQSAPDPLGAMWLKLLPAPGVSSNVRSDGAAAAQALAFFGREDRIQDSVAPCDHVVANDALATIVERAKGAQIVIINEAHHRPRDRAFITEVARALRPLGFDTFAETFSETIAATGNDAPRREDGTYTYEPAFGDEIRALRTLNFRLAPYEQTQAQRIAAGDGARIAAREQAEAENLVANIFAERPKARVIVHVGFSHLAEEERGGNLWMAARLKQMLGIDPLTIDQTSFSAPGKGASICNGGANRFAADLLVAQAPLAFVDKRPAWRLAAGQKFAAIPKSLQRPTQRAVYEARSVGEPPDATPKDRLLVEPGETLNLLLSPGEYSVTAWTAADGISAPATLVVR